jgi:methanogenic corrinoid protein MtbC1
MHPLYKEFIGYLKEENKEKSVEFVLDLLNKKEVGIVELYTEILGPSLNQMICDDLEDALCIWKEHVRTAIIRTTLELTYPYILKEKKEKNVKILNKKVVIVCPGEELHEIGARMVVDFFTLLGYKTTFVGANTPKAEIRAALEEIKPDYVGISVTNYYNLVEAERTIKLLRKEIKFDGKIIVGGNAFVKNPDVYKEIGADLLIQTFEDIKKLAEGDAK